VTFAVACICCVADSRTSPNDSSGDGETMGGVVLIDVVFVSSRFGCAERWRALRLYLLRMTRQRLPQL